VLALGLWNSFFGVIHVLQSINHGDFSILGYGYASGIRLGI
jgi:hypothetical protein